MIPLARQIRAGLKAVISGQQRDYRNIYRCDGPRSRAGSRCATRFIAGAVSRIVVTHEDITEVVAVKAGDYRAIWALAHCPGGGAGKDCRGTP